MGALKLSYNEHNISVNDSDYSFLRVAAKDGKSITPSLNSYVSVIISISIISTAWFAFAYPSVISGYNLKEAILNVKENAFLTLQHTYSYQYQINHKVKANTTNYSYRVLVNASEDKAVVPQNKSDVKYKNSALTTSASIELANNLQQLMQKVKLYREGDINLETLANKLNTTKHNLSQVINEQLHYNFFDYINHLRIEEAKELLKSTTKSELNIIQIAYDVGFNNKVTFNNAFKKHTGLTPTEFRNNKEI